VGWRSPGRAKQSIIDRAANSIIDTAEAPTATACRPSPVSARRWIAEWDWPSDAQSSVLSGEPARPIPARQFTRVALLSNLQSPYRPRIASVSSIKCSAQHGRSRVSVSMIAQSVGCSLGYSRSQLGKPVNPLIRWCFRLRHGRLRSRWVVFWSVGARGGPSS
jgi:hypothetical protein